MDIKLVKKIQEDLFTAVTPEDKKQRTLLKHELDKTELAAALAPLKVGLLFIKQDYRVRGLYKILALYPKMTASRSIKAQMVDAQFPEAAGKIGSIVYLSPGEIKQVMTDRDIEKYREQKALLPSRMAAAQKAAEEEVREEDEDHNNWPTTSKQMIRDAKVDVVYQNDKASLLLLLNYGASLKYTLGAYWDMGRGNGMEGRRSFNDYGVSANRRLVVVVPKDGLDKATYCIATNMQSEPLAFDVFDKSIPLQTISQLYDIPMEKLLGLQNITTPTEKVRIPGWPSKVSIGSQELVDFSIIPRTRKV